MVRCSVEEVWRSRSDQSNVKVGHTCVEELKTNIEETNITINYNISLLYHRVMLPLAKGGNRGPDNHLNWFGQQGSKLLSSNRVQIFFL